jgi:hypothetical protein
VHIRQPTAKPAFSALGSSGLGLNAGNPVGWGTRAGLDQTGDHPGKGFVEAG